MGDDTKERVRRRDRQACARVRVRVLVHDERDWRLAPLSSKRSFEYLDCNNKRLEPFSSKRSKSCTQAPPHSSRLSSLRCEHVSRHSLFFSSLFSCLLFFSRVLSLVCVSSESRVSSLRLFSLVTRRSSLVCDSSLVTRPSSRFAWLSTLALALGGHACVEVSK